MSSMHHRHSSRASGTKKKFGKNLNKVTKAPAPPIASSARGASSSSSRNGLLLLSTKRSSSSTGTTTASGGGGGGGLLASKSSTTSNTSPTKKPLQPPLGLTTESYTSAHDALLGAVIGASRMTDTQQPPDAWGVAAAEKQQPPSSATASAAPEPALAPKGGVSSGLSSYHPPADPAAVDVTSVEHAAAVVTPSSKETSSTSKPSDAAAAVAATRTREQRLAQEEMRFTEQKERAAERLRLLEEKIASKKSQMTPEVVSLVVKPRLSSDDGGRDAVANQTSPDASRETNGTNIEMAVPPPPEERPRTRTLFDPNRPYSSLVAGKSDEATSTNGGRQVSPTVADPEYIRSVGVPIASRNGADREEEEQQPVIHIASYETRDRGERDSNAGPRMLFDPKSGSMVTAPSRDEAASAGGRGKKGKAKGRKDRTSTRESNAEGDDSPGNGKSKRTRGRKDDKRDRKRTEDADVSAKETSSKKRGAKARSAEDRLPRTCGVLYKRDERGNLVSVDGCDGNQGYGAHSVPGGRIRNPVGHAKFVEQQEAYEQEGATELAYGMAGYENARAYYGSGESTFKSTTQEQEMVQEEVWVKPDEKIELVTGEDDSPTLQATASTWVPSQAALAAATTAKEEMISPSAKMTSDEEDSDEEHPSFVGLGFDPTENMDSVMQSPSVKASKNRDLDPVQLAALTLDAPNGNLPTSSGNIFAFGSSSTWGNGGAAGTDWAAVTSPKGVSNKGQDAAAGTASFLSLSTNNPWGSSGLSGAFGGAGAAMPGGGTNGQGSAGD